jgi:hypothetical protein
MEDAETTIKLVRQGKPVQTQTGKPGSGNLQVFNEVRPPRFGRTRRQPSADCDVSLGTELLKNKLKSIPTAFRNRSKVMLLDVNGGIALEFGRNKSKRKYQFCACGTWDRKICVSSRRLLDLIKSTNMRSFVGHTLPGASL